MSSKKKKSGRVPKACDNCKKNKQKCDVESPCFRCRKKKIECCFKGKPAVCADKKNGSNCINKSREKLLEDLLMSYFLSLGNELSFEEWNQFNEFPMCVPEQQNPQMEALPVGCWEDNEEAVLMEELNKAESNMMVDDMKFKPDETNWDTLSLS